MPGLNRMKEAIRRFSASTDTAGAGVNRTGGVRWSRQAMDMLLADSRRWDDVCRRFQEQMQETRRDGEWLCRETMRKERRARRRSGSAAETADELAGDGAGLRALRLAKLRRVDRVDRLAAREALAI